LIVLDTNVLSELARPAPDRGVVSWIRKNAKVIAIPVIAIGEMRYGIARQPESKRKRSLAAALDELVDRYAHALLNYSVLAANACGDILAAAELAGRPMSLADAQIAAIARVAHASVATRNVSDFATTRLTVVNPWDE
jgi:predicted nucleic acid-binding protein